MTVPHDALTRRGLLAASICVFAGATRAAAPELFTFDALYKSFGVRGITYSDRLVANSGRPMTIIGYMAPPLKAESTFFVLTREPMAICPFCQSDADWPADILVIYLAEASPLVSAGARIAVTGRLEIGSWVDPETGFVSQLRLRDSTFRTT
jgi:hypothetical protein